MSNGAEVEAEGPMVTNLAFVDDTSLIGTSHSNMERITETAQEFFDINGIDLNPKKTELMVYGAGQPRSIDYGGATIQPHPPDKASRSLGIWISADGGRKGTKTVVEKEVDTVCSILKQKRVTDKQCAYIINSVLIPRIQYRMTATVLSNTDMTKIAQKCRATLLSKIGLPSSTPISILHHTRFYGLRDIKDAIEEQQITSLMQRVNDKGLLGNVTHCRIQALKTKASLYESPVSTPRIAGHYTQNN
ncbi:hypothetical protein BGZ58_005318, partial [Dissophora ornata]